MTGDIRKTYKNFVGGAFVRSESGNVVSVPMPGGAINVPVSSKKDLRDAFEKADEAFPKWRARTPYNRAQILYRIAEMLESRDQIFGESVRASCDRIVYYSGWADKYQQIYSSVNPVGQGYLNVSRPVPSGVWGVILAGQGAHLLEFVSQVVPVIASGNVVVVLVPVEAGPAVLSLSEVLAISDVPAGVVNVMTCQTGELSMHMAAHGGFSGIVSSQVDTNVHKACAPFVRRFIGRSCKELESDRWENPQLIYDSTEIQTGWHSLGL